MGEFAKYNGARIKIGVCELLYYLRFEDRDKVTPLENNVNPQKDTNIFFRPPFIEEDHLGMFDFQNVDHTKSIRLRKINGKAFQPDGLTPGSLQMKHECGTLFSVPCHHGARLPDLGPDTKVYWDGRDPYFLHLRFLKLTRDYAVLPTVECKYCREMWTFDWVDVWDYLPRVYQERFQKYRDSTESMPCT
jgi:hypothetical protein